MNRQLIIGSPQVYLICIFAKKNRGLADFSTSDIRCVADVVGHAHLRNRALTKI